MTLEERIDGGGSDDDVAGGGKRGNHRRMTWEEEADEILHSRSSWFDESVSKLYQIPLESF